MQLERSTTSTWRSPSLLLSALDRGAGRDREGPAVALVAVGGVVDRQLGLAGADHGVGEAVGARRAEVGMEEVAAVGVDVGDGRGGVGGDGGVGDVLVPGGLVGERGGGGGERGRRVGEDLAAAEVGIGADGRALRPARRRARSSATRARPARLILRAACRRGTLQPLDLELADLQAADRRPVDREPTDGEPPDREAADRGRADGKRPDRRRAAHLSTGSRRRPSLRPKECDPASPGHPATVARSGTARCARKGSQELQPPADRRLAQKARRRPEGIEPSLSRPQREVLPLNYGRHVRAAA